MDRGERKFRLGLDACTVQDAKPLGATAGVVEQRGLPDSWLAADDQDPAAARPSGVEQLVDPRALP